MRVKRMCACTLVLFLIAPVAFATIIESGDYDEDSGGNGTLCVRLRETVPCR